MIYHLEITKEGESDLKKLVKSDRKLFNKVLNKIEFLSESPKEGKPLVGNHSGEFSLRIGNYRIVYMLDIEVHTIYILTVKHRKHAY